MNTIKVGKRYKAKKITGTKPDVINKDEHYTFDIIHKMKSHERPFVGISISGTVINFDEKGNDEWFEFGGNWYTLDISTEEPARRALIEFKG